MRITNTRRALLAMAGVTAGVASAAVAPTPATAAEPAPSATLDAAAWSSTTAWGTQAFGTCRSWTTLYNGNLHINLPSISRNGLDINCQLQKGDYNNDAVYKLQDMLKMCYGQGIARDGDFGPNTEKALKNVQGSVGGPASGVYDPTTGANVRWPLLDADNNFTGRCVYFP
jgi:peptidoglycan hydrolase-like protein with peptidoglycan-binding domain